MAGLTMAAGGRGGRRALDFELNMVPMIDLLMVTVSFLLITAVWSQTGRLESDAAVPGAGVAPAATEPRLHLDMTDPRRIILRWSIGPTTTRTSEVSTRELVDARPTGGASARGAGPMSFTELGAWLASEWEVAGSHRAASDRSFDELVLHTRDDAPYAEIVGAMDAAYGVKRPCAGGKACPAFRVVFASR